MFAGSRQMPRRSAADALDEADEVGRRHLLVGLERERDPGGLEVGQRLRRMPLGLVERRRDPGALTMLRTSRASKTSASRRNVARWSGATPFVPSSIAIPRSSAAAAASASSARVIAQQGRVVADLEEADAELAVRSNTSRSDSGSHPVGLLPEERVAAQADH